MTTWGRRRARARAWQRVARGALDGLVATVPMSAVMLLWQHVGHTGRLPPAHVADAALDAAGGERAQAPARRALAVAGHLAFGAAAGGVHGWWAGRLRHPGPVQGAAFGTLVWLLSYAGWIPALGILPPPQRDRRERQGMMLVAHWVYGGVLGARAARA